MSYAPHRTRENGSPCAESQNWYPGGWRARLAQACDAAVTHADGQCHHGATPWKLGGPVPPSLALSLVSFAIAAKEVRLGPGSDIRPPGALLLCWRGSSACGCAKRPKEFTVTVTPPQAGGGQIGDADAGMVKRRRPQEVVELSIDESALHACDAVGFNAHQWPRLLPQLLGLKADCLALHEQHPEENFYLRWPRAKSLLAASSRRPALLSYVSEVLDYYLDQLEAEGIPLERGRCGAEFWVQRRAAGQDITFHWYKDEALRSAADVLLHPAVSTVTYLTDGGAPTVLLEVRASAGDGISGGQLLDAGAELLVGPRRRPVEPDGLARRAAALVSYPRAGKLLAFSGALLHGVPAELAEPSETGERITLLINVWVHHQPLGVKPLPRPFAAQVHHYRHQPAHPRVHPARAVCAEHA